MEETITILKVGTDEAVKSLGDLRNNVRQLKANLNELEIGTQEYQDTLNELKINQNAVRDAMYATTASMDDLAASATGVSKTYNGLVHQMAALKEELRATDVSTEAGRKRFAELAAQINDVNSELKNMDAAQGNYQRNVGNYSQSVLDAMRSMGGGVGQAANAVVGLKTGFQTLSKVPIVAVIGAVVTVFDKVKTAITGSEKSTQALTKAFAPLTAASDLLDRALQGIGDALVWVANGITNVLDKMGLLSDEAKQRRAEAEEAIALTNLQREYLVDNAETEQKISDLRAKMAEKDKYNAEQRLAYAEEWKKELLTIAERNKELADRELALAEAEASHSENSAEVNQRLADLRVKAIQAQTNYNNQLREANAQISEIKASAVSAANAVAAKAKAVEAEAKKASDAFFKMIDDEIKASDDVLNAVVESDLQKIEQEKETARAIEQIRLDNLQKGTEQRLAYNEVEVQSEREKAENEYQIQLDSNNRRLALLREFMSNAMNDSDVDSYLAYQQDIADLEVEIQLNALEEKKRLREQDVEDARQKAEREMDAMMTVASGTSSILGSIADMYESNTELSVQEQKKVKNLRISAAIIDTISGAIAAYMSAQSVGGLAGPILGAINAATVTAAGMAQVQQIRNADVSTSPSSGGAISFPASVQAPTISTEVQNVRNVTSASEEEEINKARTQKVILVYSDIEEANERRRVQVEESSF